MTEITNKNGNTAVLNEFYYFIWLFNLFTREKKNSSRYPPAHEKGQIRSLHNWYLYVCESQYETAEDQHEPAHQVSIMSRKISTFPYPSTI